MSSLAHLLQAEKMINAIRSAFKEALDQLSWMDDQTRQAAKDKVHTDTQTQRICNLKFVPLGF